NGAVSSENLLCSEAGIDILKKGGSAMDAAISTSLCIGVTNMYSSGIGGGGFMLVRSPNSTYEYIDFREEAPAKSFTDMYEKDPRKAQVGGLAVGIPSEIRGFAQAHEKYGKLPWKDLFSAAIKISEDGWPVHHRLAMMIKNFESIVVNDPAFAEVFAPEGVPLQEGQLIKRVKLGATLRRIAEEGPDVFYEGEIGKNLVRTATEAGGILTMEDMKNYRAKFMRPLEGFYHGRRVITTPAPTSGAVLLSVLNILEGYNIASEGKTTLSVHRLVEALKFAFGQRTLLGDPVDPVYRNITILEKWMLQKELASLIRRNISVSRTFDPPYYQPRFEVKEDHGTMHVSVLTSEGEAVSLTSTVNLVFGAQLMDPVTGVILNDEMDDFSLPGVPNAFGLEPSPYNYIHPGKRPLSSSVPTIVERDGEVEMITGASGGSRIITATLQTILNVVDFGMDLARATAEPRLHHQLQPNEVYVEYEYDKRITRELELKGHKIVRYPPGFTLTGVESIYRTKEGLLLASSDMRKGGVSSGW
ncbi:gamma-glutamyltranspeptidase, partial [Zopfochytrium polystomum]